MNNYIPFLKLKGSEISALIAISPKNRNQYHPFFDFPRRDEKKTRDMSVEIKSKEDNFTSALMSTSNRLKKKLPEIKSFYLDDFDLEDELFPNGRHTYEQIIEQFSELGMIPVTGLDRSSEHYTAIVQARAAGVFKHDRIALRLTEEDFKSYELMESDLEYMFAEYLDAYKEVDVVFDCRVMKVGSDTALSYKILDFVTKLSRKFNFKRVITTGSVVPASISNIIDTNTEETFNRPECLLYERVKQDFSTGHALYQGDYTCVSPEYSDADFFVEDMQNVTTAKVMYPYTDANNLERLFIARGGRVKTDKTQYRKLSLKITSHVERFFRGEKYSFGDDLIYRCAHGTKSNVTPSSIVKPLINIHLEFMRSKK
jgi:hypothetical protein